MKTQNKKIVISYSITSVKCCKDIVKGCRIFSDEDASLKFMKRLVGIKNNLCKRTDLGQFDEVTKEAKRSNKSVKNCTDPFGYNYHSHYYGDPLPFTLKYSCQTS